MIDENRYPVKESETSNLRHRPIGIGVQGLADLFLMLKLPFDSSEAKILNEEIFETMYYAAARSSCDLAKLHGKYESFEGSPASQGILCPDMWNAVPTKRWPFGDLKKDVMKFGLRNSLLLAPMPTASTSQIHGYNECFEPYTSNIYLRRTLAGEFKLVNRHLVKDLISLGLWNKVVVNQIIKNNGSIQEIEDIPDDIKLLYRTVWELKMKVCISIFPTSEHIFTHNRI